MHIGTTGSRSTIVPGVLTPRRTPGAPAGMVSDNIHTSPRALLHSRSLAALSEQLRPRSEMIERFRATIDAPVELDDADLDRLLGNMMA